MPPDPNNSESTTRNRSFARSDDDELVKDEDLRALLEAENGLQQFDEVLRIVEEAVTAKQLQLTPEIVSNLNRLAVQNIRR